MLSHRHSNSILGTLRERVDWVLLGSTLPILAAGLATMTTFSGENHFFIHQLLSIAVSVALCFFITLLDVRFLRRTDVLIILFSISTFLLLILLGVGHVANGAKAWFSIAGFSFQPSDVSKLILILMLAKYFSRRHVEIRHWKHILISGIYALVPFLLIFLEPDFGSAMIIFFIWFGMILVSGISKRHLLLVFMIGLVAFLSLWFFVFKPYQKARISNFIHPFTDVRKSGYNVYQSTIAVGSGQVLGKGLGYGTQSRLNFLPEYQTDFVFAAFAEEWGFVGGLIILSLYVLILYRIFGNAMRGATNFEILTGVGIAIYFSAHIAINIGMNIGLLPVTGITLPFMSYGGSHLFTEFAALGLLMSMRANARSAHRDDMQHEFLGI